MTHISVNVDVTTVQSCSVRAVAEDEEWTAPQRAGADGA
ncbi:hypothetical protein FB563_8082 [Streptomyces puniciscabiei]|uniref:Uncharacterized protein n=1 Tax=Streptomyces puniciscabiei TaxID=164348 RepID=A0A542SXS0_9ACTN|nr:hypothetical protein FB563_8082 [Streptomyces puniciscabiei]